MAICGRAAAAAVAVVVVLVVNERRVDDVYIIGHRAETVDGNFYGVKEISNSAHNFILPD